MDLLLNQSTVRTTELLLGEAGGTDLGLGQQQRLVGLVAEERRVIELEEHEAGEEREDTRRVRDTRRSVRETGGSVRETGRSVRETGRSHTERRTHTGTCDICYRGLSVSPSQ